MNHLEEVIINYDKKLMKANKEIERLGNELQVQIEDNARLNEYIEEKDRKVKQKENTIKVMNDDEIRDFCIKKDLKIFELKQEIERLTAESTEWESKCYKYQDIIKEVREYIEHENFKRNILLGFSEKKYTRDILNKVLEILDKENI